MKNELLFALAAFVAVTHAPAAEKTAAQAFAKGTLVAINGNFYADEVKNFPVLVKIDGTKLKDFYATVKNAGADLCFTADADGGAMYPFEVDTWNPDGTSLVWVRLPSVKAGTKFRMYYGRAAKTENKSARNVWKGYDGVWHVNGTADDSSTNRVAGLLNDKGRAVDGVVGRAFGTASAGAGPAMINKVYADDLPNGALANPKLTCSCWIRFNEEAEPWRVLLGPKSAGNQAAWGISISGKGCSSLQPRQGSRPEECALFDTEGLFPVGRWVKIDFVVDGPKIALYVDGTPVGSKELDRGPLIGWIRWLGWAGSNLNNLTDDESVAADVDECRLYAGAAAEARVVADFCVVREDVCDFYPVGAKVPEPVLKKRPMVAVKKSAPAAAPAPRPAPKANEPPPEPLKLTDPASIASDRNFGKNPYGEVSMAPEVAAWAKTVKWVSLGGSATAVNNAPIDGATTGYQNLILAKLGMDASQLENKGTAYAPIDDRVNATPGTADVYTLEFGLEDWGAGMAIGTIEDYRKALRREVDWTKFMSLYGQRISEIRARNRDAIIILTTPRKAYGTNDRWNQTAYLPMAWDQPSLRCPKGVEEPTRLVDYVNAIREIAKEDNLPLVDWFEYGATQENLKDLSADFARTPNDKGAAILADLLAPVMAKELSFRYECVKAERAVEAARAKASAPTTWRVTALDPTHLVLQADRQAAEQAKFWLLRDEATGRDLEHAATMIRGGNRATADRPEFIGKLRSGPYAIDGKPVPTFSYWPIANGVQRFQWTPTEDESMAYWHVKDGAKLWNGVPGRMESVPMPRLLHNVFITLDRPLAKGKTVSISTPTGDKLSFTYDPNVPSPLFKVNQVGYVLDAKERYVYLGGWLGPSGAWPRPKDGTTFDLVDAATGKVVLSGPVVHRVDDTFRDDGTNKTWFSGEETDEMDISQAPAGTYYVRIEGIGRSMDFDVNATGVADVFALHMKGLFQQRCGCAKTIDLTHWTDEACHMTVWRGMGPPQEWEYGDCFVDAKGGKGTGHFALNNWQARRVQKDPTVYEKLSLPGGWHDAADFDRRPMHMRIVGDLATLYLLKPENFTDSQLAVPERGNGIPDILDEAVWGLKHLLKGQQKDGGVATWIETVRHPSETDYCVASTDPYPYFLTRATTESSIDYAGYAALLSRALEKAGTKESRKLAEEFRQSAIRAYDFALAHKPATRVPMRSGWEEADECDVWYTENTNDIMNCTEDSGDFLLELAKACINLYAVTGDEKYLKPLSSSFTDTMLGWLARRSWALSALFLAETGFTDAPGESYAKIKSFWKDHAVRTADEAAGWLTGGYAYRLPFYGPGSPWVHTMSWGNIHPFHQAKKFIAAHQMTGDRKYLDAAYLAMDYHCGCNPNGETWTSGLGKVYPTSYLSLVSANDDVVEYVPGIAPYRNCFGLPPDVSSKVYGWDAAMISQYPFLHRWGNMEGYAVTASEFTVWETVHDPAIVCGYLMGPGQKPKNDMREPAKDLMDLPGFWCLP